MKKLYFLVGFLAFLGAVIAMAPAEDIYGWTRGNLPPQVHLYAIGGTLFHGHAGQGRIDNLTVQELTWRMHPFALLTGGVSLDLTGRLAGGHTSAKARIGLGGGITLKHVVSTATLSGFKPALDTGFLPVKGQIGLNLQSAEIKNGRIKSAQGRLTVGRLAWTLTEPAVALGGYRADIGTDADGITAILKNTDAPVELNGRCALTPKNTWQAHIKLRARPNARAEVKDLLSNLGNKGSQGWYTINQSGRL